tara:strand:- start:564 stop:2453 length:1890 start_codon:yes stop_codon:yes gene_type:complete
VIELLIALALLSASCATGHFMLRSTGSQFACSSERLMFSVAVGLGSLMVAVLFLGLSHLLSAGVLFLALAVWAGLGVKEFAPAFASIRQRFRAPGLHANSPHLWLLVIAGAGLALGLIRALAPSSGATDPLAYQLALPKIYVLKHFLSFERTITGALYPSNMGLLYAVGIALRNNIVAQVLHWSMGLLCCLAILGFAHRYFDWRVGIWGFVVFSFVPVVVIFGPQGYVDVGLCFFQFMAFWAVCRWVGRPSLQALILAGVLAGLAAGTKHPGAVTFVIGAGAVFVVSTRVNGWTKGVIDTVVYLSAALLLVAPWYVRSYLAAGNPIWPLANDLFGGLPFNQAPKVISNSSATPGQQGFEALVISVDWLTRKWPAMSPWNWTFNPSGWQKAIGVYFVALVPGILLYARSKRHFLLIGSCAAYYLLLIRFLHTNPRYGLVLFAFLAVVCGVVAERLRTSGMRLTRVVFMCVFLVGAGLNITWAYVMTESVFPVALGGESREGYLTKNVSNYRMFQYANSHLPESSVILLQGIVKGYYCDRQYLWGDHPYTGVIDYDDYDSPEQLLKRFDELDITHVARMIRIPKFRLAFYPQYFMDEFHEAFRSRYMKPVYWDESYVLFEVNYPEQQAATN